MCAFWEALRRTRCRDMHMTPEQARLVRNYNRKLSVDSMKKRVINSAVTLGIYTRGINHDNPLQDACEALLRMNDNDIYNAVMYKSKKLRQYNPEELADTFESDELHAHLLRHTFATSYLVGGGNLEFLRAFLGHSDYNVTRGYSQLAAECKMLGVNVYHLDPIFFKKGY